MKRLGRRTILRGLAAGAAIGVGLPRLEAMFGSTGDAFAATAPKRFGIWFWGGGVRLNRWVPKTTGANWEPNVETEPLRAHRDYVSVVSGMGTKNTHFAHHGSTASILTGADYRSLGAVRDTIKATHSKPTLDQIVAKEFEVHKTKFRSLVLGVCTPGTPDEGSIFEAVSHNGPNSPNQPIFNPQAAFDTIFANGAGLPPEVSSSRASVLDAVQADFADLRNRLGRDDQRRVDEHLAGIRALEQQIKSTASCAQPPRPGGVPGLGTQQVDFALVNRQMTDLLAVSLACDYTRSFCFQFCQVGAQNPFPGGGGGLHGRCHFEGLPQPGVDAMITFIMSQFAYFCEKMKNTPDGAGNLLDSMAVLGTTDLSEGYSHDDRDYPILVAGRAGGALRSGVHYRSTSDENTSKVLLTLLQAVGVPLTSFGENGGYTTETLSAIKM